MTKYDINQDFQFSDVPAALGLLSRLPIPVDTARATARGATAAWAYPLAGAVLALLAGLIGLISSGLGLQPQLSAAMTLGVLIITTGAMHEDGLADSADGLWGGWTAERRLDIMKDSRIGVYGVLALGLSLIIRWQAIALLWAAGSGIASVLVAAICSRAAMVVVMRKMSHARPSGLSRQVGKPARKTMRGAIALAAGLTLLLSGWAVVPVFIASTVVVVVCMAIAHRKIGGQTGDILGATQQCTEIACLLCLTALWA